MLFPSANVVGCPVVRKSGEWMILCSSFISILRLVVPAVVWLRLKEPPFEYLAHISEKGVGHVITRLVI